jgi:hypothetical protein
VTFTYWILLGILHGKIFHFPGHMSDTLAGLQALQRFADFLSRGEWDELTYVKVADTPDRPSARPLP